EQVGESAEEAARSLGAGRLRTLRTVSIPLLFPALVGGGLLAFVTALGEFIASAILFTPGNKPISVAIFGEFHAGAYGLCSAYGVFLILLIGAVMLIGGRSSQRIV
ncbi:MAG: ABC transporter permease subunit, partial [Candidatus Omnitrophica bacterium]|nr:ABC transporter permease subunit [Candidatus Omnitrophota bacterium]